MTEDPVGIRKMDAWSRRLTESRQNLTESTAGAQKIYLSLSPGEPREVRRPSKGREGLGGIGRPYQEGLEDWEALQ